MERCLSLSSNLTESDVFRECYPCECPPLRYVPVRDRNKIRMVHWAETKSPKQPHARTHLWEDAGRGRARTTSDDNASTSTQHQHLPPLPPPLPPPSRTRTRTPPPIPSMDILPTPRLTPLKRRSSSTNHTGTRKRQQQQLPYAHEIGSEEAAEILLRARQPSYESDSESEDEVVEVCVCVLVMGGVGG